LAGQKFDGIKGSSSKRANTHLFHQISRARIEIDKAQPGKIGSLVLFSPTSAKTFRRLNVPANLLNNNHRSSHMIIALLSPRIKPSGPRFTSTSAFSRHEDKGSNSMLQVLGECKGKKYSITNYRKTESVHTLVLKKILNQQGAKPDSLYKGKPHFLFIQTGTPPEKIPGIAHRRFHYPETRFIRFGRSSFSDQRAIKEIWPIGMRFCEAAKLSFLIKQQAAW
jgi:hypothetical protein